MADPTPNAEAIQFREGWNSMMRSLEDARNRSSELIARLYAEGILTRDRVVSPFFYGRAEACIDFLNGKQPDKKKG